MLLKQLADTYYRNSRKVPATYRGPPRQSRSPAAGSSSTSTASSSLAAEDKVRDEFFKTMTDIVEAKKLADKKLETPGGDLGMMEDEAKKLAAAVTAGIKLKDKMNSNGMYSSVIEGTTVEFNVDEVIGHSVSTIKSCVNFLKNFQDLKNLQMDIGKQSNDETKKRLQKDFENKRDIVMNLKKRCEGSQEGMFFQTPKIPNTQDIQLVLEAINKLADQLKSSPTQVSATIHEVQKEAEMTGESCTDKVTKCKERLMKRNFRELQNKCMALPDRDKTKMPCRIKQVMAQNMCTQNSDIDV